jgi:hypothetical protein
MKKPALTPGLEEVMMRLMSCKNFEPNPAFKKTRAKKPGRPKRKG